MKSSNIKYVPALDHLRGFAALLVMAFHCVGMMGFKEHYARTPDAAGTLSTNSVWLSWFFEGHTAVALFMVLSGFLFTFGCMGRDIHSGKFLWNRFVRTYPLYLLLVFTGISAHSSGFSFDAFLQTICGLANTKGAVSAGHFTMLSWAIAVEWQFYVLFPFLLILLNRFGTKPLRGIIWVAIILRLLVFFEGGDIHAVAYGSIIGRIDQFLIGMLLAVWYKRNAESKAPWELVMLGTLVAISATLYGYHKLGGIRSGHIHQVFWPTFEGLLWALFIRSYIDSARQLPKFLDQLFSKFGELSYSMYLTHSIVISIFVRHEFFVHFGFDVLTDTLLNLACFIVPLTTAISLLTYNFIEKPFLALRVKYHVGNEPSPDNWDHRLAEVVKRDNEVSTAKRSLETDPNELLA